MRWRTFPRFVHEVFCGHGVVEVRAQGTPERVGVRMKETSVDGSSQRCGAGKDRERTGCASER